MDRSLAASRPVAMVALLALAAAGAVRRAAAGAPARAPRGDRVPARPGPAAAGPSMIERLAAIPAADRARLRVGDPGRLPPEQVLLDISAGARVASSLYDEDLPPAGIGSPEGRGGRITGWEEIARPGATEPPADLDPGTLGGAVRAAGMRGRIHREPGRLGTARRSSPRTAPAGSDRVSLYGRGDARRASLRRVDPCALRWSLSLPGGTQGQLGDRTACSPPAGPRTCVLVVQQPAGPAPGGCSPPARPGSTGGTDADVRTRPARDGLVVTTDIAPTVLDRLGLRVPDRRRRASRSRPPETPMPPALTSSARAGRDRPAALGGGARRPGGSRSCCSWRWLALRHRGDACGGRRGCALLAALWLPAVLLATGALAPSRRARDR